jgi:hypothetical protein
MTSGMNLNVCPYCKSLARLPSGTWAEVYRCGTRRLIGDDEHTRTSQCLDNEERRDDE